MSKDKLDKVGTYDLFLNSLIGKEFDKLDIYMSSGLIKHLKKRKHYDVLPYMNKIDKIIANPTYFGYDKNNDSLLYIKEFEDNVLVAVKLDYDKNQYFVATAYVRPQYKIDRMLYSKKIVPIDKK